MRKSILFEGITVTLLILLVFMLIAMIMGESGPSEHSIPGSDQVQYIYTGSDSTLYMFSDSNIRAFDADGNELWDFTLPAQLKISPGWRFSINNIPWGNPYVWIDTNGGPVVFADNDTLYVYVAPNETYTGAEDGQMSEGLIAISGKGKELWSLPLHSLLVNVTQYTFNAPRFKAPRIITNITVMRTSLRRAAAFMCSTIITRQSWMRTALSYGASTTW